MVLPPSLVFHSVELHFSSNCLTPGFAAFVQEIVHTGVLQRKDRSLSSADTKGVYFSFALSIILKNLVALVVSPLQHHRHDLLVLS